jgi:hypothetical protein
MPIPYDTNGVYAETVDDWTITTYSHSPGEVRAVGPSPPPGPGYEQEFTIDKDGDVCVEVNRSERGRGFHDGYAEERHVPVAVLAAAIRVWTVSRD